MIEKTRILMAVMVVLMFAGTPGRADELRDQQVERGTKAYKDGDYERAKLILLPLAEAGHPKAINVMGLMYKNGGGFPTTPDVACDLFERSANLGYKPAMYNLSRCFGKGFGRPENHKMEYEWLVKAANDGYVRAMLRLVDHEHSTGEDNRYWLKTAASHGSKFAAAKLWLHGHKEDAPDFSLLDELCVIVRIGWLQQGIFVCDE